LSPERQLKLIQFLHACKLLIELHEVDGYAICATSALREAVNKKEVTERVRRELGLEIEVIDGDREAELVGKVIAQTLDDKNYLHIDVGGGSTELNLYADNRKLASKSFKIGTVRQLEHADSPLPWKQMEAWIKEHLSAVKGPITAIGTGGNISKIFELAPNKKDSKISRQEIINTRDYIARFTEEDRINKLKLNPDRADVIVPATDIYLSAMKWAGAEQMRVPDIGLKDGMLLMLYENAASKGR
jgi:exopolyphosphatase/guanosine-5'-triphosphate,3'-diphosphate pyrophosphatase